MKRAIMISICVSAALVTAVICARAAEFKIKEFKEFHDVLHPLEHESMPKQDYESIRNKADELVRLGNAIVRLGVPRGTKPSQVEAYENELKNFSQSLKRFSGIAKNGKDEDVRLSFSAVHDSFEMLAGMLPRD